MRPTRPVRGSRIPSSRSLDHLARHRRPRVHALDRRRVGPHAGHRVHVRVFIVPRVRVEVPWVVYLPTRVHREPPLELGDVARVALQFSQHRVHRPDVVQTRPSTALLAPSSPRRRRRRRTVFVFARLSLVRPRRSVPRQRRHLTHERHELVKVELIFAVICGVVAVRGSVRVGERHRHVPPSEQPRDDVKVVRQLERLGAGHERRFIVRIVQVVDVVPGGVVVEEAPEGSLLRRRALVAPDRFAPPAPLIAHLNSGIEERGDLDGLRRRPRRHGARSPRRNVRPKVPIDEAVPLNLRAHRLEALVQVG